MTRKSHSRTDRRVEGSGVAVLREPLARAADRGSLVLGILLIPPFAVPTWFGAWLFRRGSSEVYRRACLWLLIVMGLAVILL